MNKIDEELNSLLQVLPLRIQQVLSEQSDINQLIEVVLDLGKPPEARFTSRVFYIPGDNITQADIDYPSGY